MKNYKNRERKQKSKKNRMPKHGRSLLNVIERVTVEKSQKIRKEDKQKLSQT